MGWWYVFGSASITLLVIQVLSGMGLALVYVPTTEGAYQSLAYLNYQQPLGWFVRSLHYWSGSAMVVMVVVHLIQVFLHGAFKYPRELNWLTGVVLLFLTLGMAFTGQVMRWDADAYWGVGVGASMAGRVPILGPYLVDLLLGGPIIGALTLSRFFALHVFVIPGLLLALLALHLWLVLKRGISATAGAGKDRRSAHLSRGVREGAARRGRSVLRRSALEGRVLVGSDRRRGRSRSRARRAQGPGRAYPSPRSWGPTRSRTGHSGGCSRCFL